jgi:hypothetical protein
LNPDPIRIHNPALNIVSMWPYFFGISSSLLQYSKHLFTSIMGSLPDLTCLPGCCIPGSARRARCIVLYTRLVALLVNRPRRVSMSHGPDPLCHLPTPPPPLLTQQFHIAQPHLYEGAAVIFGNYERVTSNR